MAAQEERLPIYLLDRLNVRVSADPQWQKEQSDNAAEDHTREIAFIKLVGHSVTFPHGYFKTLFNDKEHDVIFVSENRFVTIMMDDILYRLKIDQEDSVGRITELFELITETDKKFNPNTVDEAASGTYAKLLQEEYRQKTEILERNKAIVEKQRIRQEAKALINRKFRIGSLYATDSPEDENENTGIYKCVKPVYTIGKNIVNAVVMEHISGDVGFGKRKTLSVHDCKALHIKYRTGLYMFNMNKLFYKKE